MVDISLIISVIMLNMNELKSKGKDCHSGLKKQDPTMEYKKYTSDKVNRLKIKGCKRHIMRMVIMSQRNEEKGITMS